MRFAKLIAVSLFALLSVPVVVEEVRADHDRVNGCGSDPYARAIRDEVFANFTEACNNHDRCYGIIGNGRGDCDNRFYNEMIDRCDSTYDDWYERPTRSLCYGSAELYYQAVNQFGGRAYERAQQHARQAREASRSVELPTTVTEVTRGGDECHEVSSRQGWQYFNLLRPRTRVVSISGSWSVDSRSYPSVGAGGHSGDAASRLEPYNQYKYDRGFAFGALFVDIPTDGYGYVQVSSPQSLPRTITRTAMRINDADNALGDNAGSLRVCFGS
ncbi:hypothetical protein [Leptolyngbya sp. FACHB-711]|uniref:hypothetical protein n=1 Tax=Leptolyngbya sp. FACHB-711 TaxID=2692813 RepID=UPI0016855675|nr:hypothetical protein [Leptolyngbya sp. FACHB-711]MBD2024852.1 hypothetical protein [Leptolyngbya sp. FACHB-711]